MAEQKPVVWLDNWSDNTTDPQDGLGPITFWWEDIRRSATCETVHEAYERGIIHGASALDTMRTERDAALGDVRRLRAATDHWCERVDISDGAWQDVCHALGLDGDLPDEEMGPAVLTAIAALKVELDTWARVAEAAFRAGTSHATARRDSGFIAKGAIMVADQMRVQATEDRDEWKRERDSALDEVDRLRAVIAGSVDPIFASSLREQIRSEMIVTMGNKVTALQAELAARVPWEPRPWKDIVSGPLDAWEACGGDWLSVQKGDPEYDGIAYGEVPIRDGQLVSWAEVEEAVNKRGT